MIAGRNFEQMITLGAAVPTDLAVDLEARAVLGNNKPAYELVIPWPPEEDIDPFHVVVANFALGKGAPSRYDQIAQEKGYADFMRLRLIKPEQLRLIGKLAAPQRLSEGGKLIMWKVTEPSVDEVSGRIRQVPIDPRIDLTDMNSHRALLRY